MKKIILFSLLNLLSIACFPQQKKILFLGNSYTYVNNLPQTIKDIVLSKGDSIIFDSNTPGGYTLQGHSTNATSIQKINQQNWDYVVLQEQSQLPSFSPSQVASDVYPYARILDSMILANDSCTETVFYMTWGRQNGDVSNCGSYPPVCTYDGMQQRLRESYMEMALNNHASVSPVGVAWKRVRDNYPAINLYQADESHPSIYGTYLAACVFYSTLFHNSSVGAYITPGISSADALILQNIASSTVLDSISNWQDTGDIPWAYYTYSLNGSTVTFNNTSFNASNFIWDFGDGSNSSLTNPSHTFATNGQFIVSLNSSNNCSQSIFTDTINIQPTLINEQTEKQYKLFPNPTSEKLTIAFGSLQTNVTLTVFDITGKLVKSIFLEKEGNIHSLDVRDLEKGVYLLSISFADHSSANKLFIKE